MQICIYWTFVSVHFISSRLHKLFYIQFISYFPRKIRFGHLENSWQYFWLMAQHLKWEELIGNKTGQQIALKR